MPSSDSHIPVLLDETIEHLDPRPGETALDCTAGQGGHAAAIAQRIGPGGNLAIVDADPDNLAHTAARVRSLPKPPALAEFPANFAEAPRRMVDAGLRANLVLADLGFASTQMNDPRRGFSFKGGGPLDMRYDPAGPMTAADLVAELPEAELAEIIRDYGEERRWRLVARKLVEARKQAPITTTSELAEIVRSAVGGGGPGQRIDPATRTFQALRIAVNDELASLESLLEAIRRVAGAGLGAAAAPSWLAPGARIGVIAFHSLEDRLVKRVFAELVDRGLAERLTRKPVTPSEDEIDRNRRSRSARLRAIRLTEPRSVR